MRLSPIITFCARAAVAGGIALLLIAPGSGGSSAAPADTHAAQETRPARLYRKHCAVCHGDRGDGQSWAKSQMRPAPRDFTSAQAQTELTRERIVASVTHGRPGTAMAAFGSRLREDEIGALADHILNAFMAVARAPAEVATAANMSAPMPESLTGDAEKGAVFYMANCATCHGASGDGQGPRAYFIVPKPRNFLHPDSLRRFNRPALFDAIALGKPGTEMPAWNKVLNRQEIADVAEFVFRRFILPTTAQDRSEYLEQGRQIYAARCYFCHGYSGDARTLASTRLAPPPRNFTAPAQTGREQMREAVTRGRPGTAMQGYAGILSSDEIAAVTDFVRDEFMRNRGRNPRYHTPENGWAQHERHAAAFPFAAGDISLARPVETLSAEQREGRRLFLDACIVCHDRAPGGGLGAVWESRPLSYPRNGYAPGQARELDGMTSASPYLSHDRAPKISGLSTQEQRGAALFQNNCAFCHAADGTARNWIGSFMLPHPRDLTDREFMSRTSKKNMATAIREGLPGTSMPAWKAVLSEAEILAVIAYISRAFHPLAE